MNAEKNGKVYGKCEEELNVVDGEDFKASKFGYRHQQCLIMFICLATAYSMRACIGVALVGMIDDTYLEENPSNFTNNTFMNNTAVDANASQYNANLSLQEIRSFIQNDTETFKKNGLLGAFLLIPPYPEFRWSKRVQDVMISSFFWGYMVLQIPAGQLVHRFGPRYLLGGALTVNCVMSFCFPWASYYGGWVLAMIFRIVQGLTQACIIPGMYGFLGQWTPLEERSRLAGFCMGGSALGTVLGLPLTGFIAESPLGWPGIFRLYGILSGLVAILVFIMVRDKPQQHPKISVAERNHIEEGLLSKNGPTKGVLKVPWKNILRCRSLYGVILVHISHNWGLVVLFAEIPFFMNKVLGVDIQSNGMLTALPFLGMWFMNFFWNWLTDHIIVKKWLSVTNARKLANSIGCVFPALGLVILAFTPKNVYIAETLLVIICGTKVAANVGFMVTLIDIAPNFASTLMSLSNFVCNLVGSQAPMVIGLILSDASDKTAWRKVFCLTASLYFFSNLAYLFLSSSERAPWNDPEQDGEENLPEKQTMLDNLGMDLEDEDTEKLNGDKLSVTKLN